MNDMLPVKLNPVEQPEPMEIQIDSSRSLKVRVKSVNKAARQVGCTTLSASRIAAIANIGEFVNETGAMYLGFGILMMTGESLDKALKKCEDLLQQVTDPELAVAILGVQKELAGKRIDMALAFTKMKGQAVAGTNASASQSFPPDSIVIGSDRPVQINVLGKPETPNA